MIFIVSIAIILNIVFLVVYLSVRETQKSSGEKRLQTSAMAIAEAGKEKLYGEIVEKTFIPVANSRIRAYTDFGIGAGSFTVTCSSNVTLDTVWIESYGKDNTSSAHLSIVASITPATVIAHPPIRGAVTARSFVNVLGNITIDGRDHDTLLNVIDSGLFGVSTCAALNFNSNSCQVGGYGQLPVIRTDTAGVLGKISEQGIPPSANLASPEAFLGLPAGALDEYKTATLTPPFHGIYYVTNSVGPVHFDGSSGILIVHNSFKTAELTMNDGTFKGLIIADMVGQVNGNCVILGAVVTISETDISSFGNGSAQILYSEYVMNNLGKYCENVKKKITEVSWREIK